ncbi:MAG: hypothetical protein WBO97_02285 [Tepidiformaceae bacterium]
MLRKSHESWWRRLISADAIPARIQQERAVIERSCPECSHTYDPRDRYCGRCHVATPEWRYG